MHTMYNLVGHKDVQKQHPTLPNLVIAVSFSLAELERPFEYHFASKKLALAWCPPSMLEVVRSRGINFLQLQCGPTSRDLLDSCTGCAKSAVQWESKRKPLIRCVQHPTTSGRVLSYVCCGRSVAVEN